MAQILKMKAMALECYPDKQEEAKETYKKAIEIYEESEKHEIVDLLLEHVASIGKENLDDPDTFR